MLFCTYCGNSLAIEKKSGPEHLILPHERNEKVAVEALESFLDERGLALPKKTDVDFLYAPFMMIEDDTGRLFGRPGSKAPPEAGPIRAVPAGEYRFFDAAHAGGEKVAAVEESDLEGLPVVRIVHLPLYRIAYFAAGKRRKAMVFGESLQVSADDLPPARPRAPSFANLAAAAAVFAALLFAGRLGHSASSRAIVIAGLASAGWATAALRERLVSRSG